jgi:SAM-dependent methyltransferase
MSLLERVRTMPDEEWLDLLVRAVDSDNPSLEGIPLPRVPSFETQLRFNVASNTTENLRNGFLFYRVLRDQLARLGRPLTPDSRVLDFGCGWGRIARFLLRDVRPENLYGIDPDEVAISTITDVVPYGTFRRSDVWPPSGFDAETFDLVYAMSVFSHLPEELHLAWVRELARILRPGGVLVATTLRRDFVLTSEWFTEPGAALTDYDAGRMVFLQHSPWTPEYGMALIPRAYVEQRWTIFLDVQNWIDDPHVLHQAVIVATKR